LRVLRRFTNLTSTIDTLQITISFLNIFTVESVGAGIADASRHGVVRVTLTTVGTEVGFVKVVTKNCRLILAVWPCVIDIVIVSDSWALTIPFFGSRLLVDEGLANSAVQTVNSSTCVARHLTKVTNKPFGTLAMHLVIWIVHQCFITVTTFSEPTDPAVLATQGTIRNVVGGKHFAMSSGVFISANTWTRGRTTVPRKVIIETK
jgi:hypothetical protein